MFWTYQVEGGPKRVNHASVVVNDIIYCFGGYCNEENYESRRPMDVHILNPERLKWFAVPLPKVGDPQYKQIPYQRYGHTAVTYGDKVIIWGGRNDRAACNRLFSFDTNKLVWRRIKECGPRPGARDGHSACIIGHRMYIFGGFEEYLDKFSNDIHSYDFLTSKWTFICPLNDPPSYRDFHTATAIDHKIYIFGGRSDYHAPYHSQEEYYNNEIMYFDTITYKWNKPFTTGNIPLGRRSHSAFTYKNNIYIFGGYNGELKRHFNDIYKFSHEKNEWTKMNPMGVKPCGRRRQCCCIVKDKLYMFGGTSPDREINMDADYSDSEQENRLIDHGDLYVLDFAPSLQTLCLIMVSKHNLQKEWFPDELKLEIQRLNIQNRALCVPQK